MAVSPTPAKDHEDEPFTLRKFQKLQNQMKK